jgi:hypothetical protein
MGGNLYCHPYANECDVLITRNISLHHENLTYCLSALVTPTEDQVPIKKVSNPVQVDNCTCCI